MTVDPSQQERSFCSLIGWRSNERAQLAALHQELDDVDTVDAETLTLLRQLAADIQPIIATISSPLVTRPNARQDVRNSPRV